MDSEILVCGVNWLGDSVMSMPALQCLGEQRPDVRVTVLVKSQLASLWEYHGSVEVVHGYEATTTQTFRCAQELHRTPFECAYVFPNSFRAAFIPLRAGVRRRIGLRGKWRRWLLTDVVSPPHDSRKRHQLWEYFAILGIDPPADGPPPPRLRLPVDLKVDVQRRFEIESGPVIGLIPGAARGPSKQWPAEHFCAVGKTLACEAGCRVLVLGTAKEHALCDGVATAIGPSAVNLAGRTSLAEFAALLERCGVVVTNDCGGMHLAAAMGTSVVAMFGLTDPATTGPIGRQHRVLAAEGVFRSRDIPRGSASAASALRSIDPTRVAGAALEILESESSHV